MLGIFNPFNIIAIIIVIVIAVAAIKPELVQNWWDKLNIENILQNFIIGFFQKAFTNLYSVLKYIANSLMRVAETVAKNLAGIIAEQIKEIIKEEVEDIKFVPGK